MDDVVVAAKAIEISARCYKRMCAFTHSHRVSATSSTKIMQCVMTTKKQTKKCTKEKESLCSGIKTMTNTQKPSWLLYSLHSLQSADTYTHEMMQRNVSTSRKTSAHAHTITLSFIFCNISLFKWMVVNACEKRTWKICCSSAIFSYYFSSFLRLCRRLFRLLRYQNIFVVAQARIHFVHLLAVLDSS